MTIPQFTKAYQLRRAGDLLIESLSSVAEIAEQVGYEDPSHFARRSCQKLRELVSRVTH